MQDRPTQHDILDAVQRFLDEEVVPSLDGRRQFLARVSANLLRMLDRELAYEEEHLAHEWIGLDELLGSEPPPEGRVVLREALQRRNEQLCERIRAAWADAGPRRAQLVAHLRRTVQDKLVVTNPAYVAPPGKEPRAPA